MYSYRISIQFAAADAPDFEKIMPIIDSAVEYYNTKSLIAKNPKRIVEKKLLDSRTLQVLLQSEAELPYPGKALRLFSGYLVDPSTEGHLNQYISGKQLFKMQADLFFNCSNNRGKTSPVQHPEDIIGLGDTVEEVKPVNNTGVLQLICEKIQLLGTQLDASNRTLDEIKSLLAEAR